MSMKKETCRNILFIFAVVATAAVRLPLGALGDPRDEPVQLTCTNQTQQNSTLFVANLVNAMEVIRQEMGTQGYGAVGSGRGVDAVYILSQCYGDISLTDCVLCYTAARNLVAQCFPNNGARLFLDGCFMRSGNYSFFQEYTGPGDRAVCGNGTMKDSSFQDTARRAVLQAVSQAPAGNGFARAEMPVSGTGQESAYVLAQCWRTLNASSCGACLENALTSVLGCLPLSEGRAINTGCFIRYSDTNFLNPIPSNGSSSGIPSAVIVGIVCSTVVVVVVAIVFAYIWKHRRIPNKRKGSFDVKKLVKILRDSSLHFKYSTLEKATSGFDDANKIGQGGYGKVYKGVLPDGREIAIKRLFLNTMHRAEEFFNEVNIISCIEHKNLVRLLGCSCTGSDSLLVYEFLPNRSLDRFIFDPNERKFLGWEKRFEIIVGIAEGLVHLHENPKMRIIHRDIKASNILLDARLRAKIADFGLVRAFADDKSHLSTAIAGTLGYMAPEYLAYGQLTEKADVYSFGVVMLEIVTGQQNNKSNSQEAYSESLLTTAWKLFLQGTTDKLIDPNLILNDDYHDIGVKNEVVRVIHIALLCAQEIAALRPSMVQTLQMLAKKDEHLPPPTNPPFIDDEKIIDIDSTFEDSSAPSTIPSYSVFDSR